MAGAHLCMAAPAWNVSLMGRLEVRLGNDIFRDIAILHSNMKNIKPSPLNSSCNQAMLISAVAKHMSAKEKRAFAATLDLHEPASLLTRGEDIGNGAVEAKKEQLSTMGLLMRIGDQDLIEGAIMSDRFVERAPFVRGDGPGIEMLPWTVLIEGCFSANARALRLADERLSKITDVRHPFYAQLDSASKALAQQGDANDAAEVKACAKILLDLHAGRTESTLSEREKKSKSLNAKMLDEKQAEAQRLLLAACLEGSENLAAAALSLGAEPTVQCAYAAAASENPGLARSLLVGAWDHWQEAATSRRIEFLAMMQGLGDSWALDAIGNKEKTLRRKELGMLDDFGALTLAAAALAKAPDILEALAQRQALAPAMELSKEFKDPAAWRVAARDAFPIPDVSELVGLARTGQWKLCSARLADAKANGVDDDWRSTTTQILSEEATVSALNEDSFIFERKFSGKRPRKRPSGDLWSLKLALEISDAGLGFKPGHPVKDVSQALVDNGKEKRELDAEVAKWEAGKLRGSSAKSTQSTPARRL